MRGASPRWPSGAGGFPVSRSGPRGKGEAGGWEILTAQVWSSNGSYATEPNTRGNGIVLDGDRLVGHGVNAVEIYNRARTQGVISPYLMEIPLEEELPFGGW
jgi:hypothetical protein